MVKKNITSCRPGKSKSVRLSGILCSLFFLFTYVASGFMPPIKPYWSANKSPNTYDSRDRHSNRRFAHAGISAPTRRTADLHQAVNALQIACDAVAIFKFMTVDRLDQSVEITQMLIELFWITALMPWPTFLARNSAFECVLMISHRPNSLFPNCMVVSNIALPMLFVPTLAINDLEL